MKSHDLLMLLPLLVLLVWAAIEDLRTRRIRNWLTLTLALAGLALSLSPVGRVGLSGAALGLLTGFVVGLPFFLLGLRGGGDVKLMAAVGAWLGPADVWYVFLAATVIAVPVALAQAAAQRRLRPVLRDTAVLALGMAVEGPGALRGIAVRRPTDGGNDSSPDTGAGPAEPPPAVPGGSSKWRLPVAVPVLIAVLWRVLI